MTLDEAILHAREKAERGGECAAEHAQLAEWLEELRELREGGEYKRGYEDGLHANTKAAFAAAKQAAEYWKRMYEETFAERTCKITEYDEAPYPVCSECGAVQPEDFTVYYCWNCGAKVVER